MNDRRLTIKLEPRSISNCAYLPQELSFMDNALQHQVDVFEKSRDADIILDLAPTGTGKTKAGLTVLLHQPTQNAIYIAPTNALVEQQREAAEKFVRDAGLPHVVKAASAKKIRHGLTTSVVVAKSCIMSYAIQLQFLMMLRLINRFC